MTNTSASPTNLPQGAAPDYGWQPDSQAYAFPDDLRANSPFGSQKLETVIDDTIHDQPADDSFYVEEETNPLPAWRRQKEPVPPRVAPNPVPVVPDLNQPISASHSPSARSQPSSQGGSRMRFIFPVLFIFCLVGIGFAALYYQTDRQKQVASNGTPQANQNVLEVEQLLARLDFNPGSIDGRPDPSLTQAIMSFQQMFGGATDGQISPQLMDELREVAQMMAPGS